MYPCALLVVVACIEEDFLRSNPITISLFTAFCCRPTQAYELVQKRKGKTKTMGLEKREEKTIFSLPHSSKCCFDNYSISDG